MNGTVSVLIAGVSRAENSAPAQQNTQAKADFVLGLHLLLRVINNMRNAGFLFHSNDGIQLYK